MLPSLWVHQVILYNLIYHSSPEERHVCLSERNPRSPAEVLRQFADKDAAVVAILLLGDVLHESCFPLVNVER